MKYWMWLLPLTFFAYQFILRLWPSLMMQPVMQQFSIDATAFGLLVSVYYYGYAGMQIPIALLLERFGARYIVFVSALVCGMATLLFTYTQAWPLALLSRFLIGAGSAVGFLGVSVVVAQWFAKHHYTRLIGFSFTFGLMGAIYGGKPVSLLVEKYGGQQVAVSLAGVAIIIGLLSWLFLRSPKTHTQPQEKLTFGDFKSLLLSPTIWLLGIANLLMVGTLEGFADVWGVNYLMAAYPLGKSDAAELSSFIFVGMLFGGPLLALLSHYLGTYTVTSLCGIGIAMGFFGLIFTPGYSWLALAALFFILGILCCYQVLIFATGCALVSRQLLGITVAFLNCINMLGGSFFHVLIGWVMDVFWQGAMEGGIRHYSLESYHAALLVIPICALLGAGLMGMVGLHQARRRALSDPGVKLAERA